MSKDTKKIVILGAEYTVNYGRNGIKNSNDGECGAYKRVINIRHMDDMLIGDDDVTDAEKEARWKEVFRHELVHAFFIESGLNNYSSDEVLVDWIARQFPKLFELFNELEITEGY